MAAARARWGNNVAAGKLGVVLAPGRKPRLFGDGSVSGANSAAQVLEKVSLPSLTSLQQFLSLPGASGEEWSCFAFDMRGAHKTILANEAEQGLSASVFNDTWYTYRSCFFVAKWAPYWFARLGAQLVRFLHSFIFLKHAVFLYVDDGLILMPSKIAPLVSCCVILFFEALGVPLSWEKLHLGKEIPWLGWGFNFTLRVALLPADKVSRIVQMLQPLLVAGQRVERKSLEQVIGLLLWYTTGARWLRPWLQPFYGLLYKPHAVFRPIAAPHFAIVKNLLASDLSMRPL